jgi:sugar lactone lactonase YvrE
MREASAQADPDGCTPVRGLTYPRSVTLSPDGRNVYAASDGSSAVAEFARDARTGALRQLGGRDSCIATIGGPAVHECPRRTGGLGSAFGIGVSPDGRDAYVASAQDSAIAHFARNTRTGALSPRGCLTDSAAHTTDLCRKGGLGLRGAVSATVSHDGRRVYVAAFYGSSLAVFARDPKTGALRRMECVDDPVAPSRPAGPRCGRSASFIEGPRNVVLSPDGRYAYVPASVGADVAGFAITPVS